MPQDICLTSATRSHRVPRFAIGIGLVALFMALIVTGETPEPRSAAGAAHVYEDWHGNVRRSR